MRRAVDRTLWACLLALTLAATAEAEPGSKAAAAARAATAGPFTAREQESLGAGKMVSRPLSFDDGAGHYVGGVSYQVVDARPELVLAALSDVNNWPEALPRTKSAHLL